MKFIIGLFLSLSFIANLSAETLCDDSCELSISFPDGGAIESDRSVELTFGEGGFVTNNGVTTGFADGEELDIEDDEPMVFQSGGQLVLGSGGNIKYSDLTITSNGVMNLAAVGGDREVSIRNISLIGDLTLNMSSDFKVKKRRFFYIKSGSVVAKTDLTFKNDGYVSGLFVFGDATLIQGRKRETFTGEISLQSGHKLKIISKVAQIAGPPVVVEPPEVVVPPVVTPPVVEPVDDTLGSAGGSDSTVDSEPSAYGATSGSVSLYGLLAIGLLFVASRKVNSLLNS